MNCISRLVLPAIIASVSIGLPLGSDATVLTQRNDCAGLRQNDLRDSLPDIWTADTMLTSPLLFEKDHTGGEVTQSSTQTGDGTLPWTLDGAQIAQTLPADDQWWKGFDDPVLDSLILMGENGSYNLSIAMHRMELAKLQWDSATAAYFPTIGLNAGWSRQRTSGDISPLGEPITTSAFSLGLTFNWEIDIFGRVAAQRKEGKASYQASQAEYAAAMVSMAASIARAYSNLRMVQAEIAVAKGQIESQEKILAMTETRHEVGLVSKLDVAQARGVLYSTQATLPSLEALQLSAISSLATLTGRYPAELQAMLMPAMEQPNPFRIVEVGVPLDLLRRRPDIVAAERQLAAYAAAAGIAKKDFLPVLSLTGSIGTEAHNIKDLFKSRSFTYTIAPQLSWTVFDGLARRYRVAEAKEQLIAGIDNYNLTVTTAVNETQNAINTYMASLRNIELTRKVVDQYRETYDLSVDRYKNGLTPFSDVMTAQINLLQYLNSLVQARATALNSLIGIYQAVGGAPEKL